MKSKTVIVAMSLLGTAVLSAAATTVLTITVSEGDLIATRRFLVQGNAASNGWALSAPIALVANGVQLGTIKNLDVQSDVDPYVNLHFAVEADFADTTFDINSSVVSFAPLLNPTACASAGIALTSDDGGAKITGLFDGGRTYQARYNGSTVYANLVDGFSIAANQTAAVSDRSPASGYQTIFDTVSSIESEFNFTLSAMEQASGTSRFEVDGPVPEPMTMAAVGMGIAGLGGYIRHRRMAAK